MESQYSSLPNLFCEEDEYFLTETHDFQSVSESDCEFVEMLLERETRLRPSNVNAVNSVWTERCSWFESLRLDAIKWILQKRALFGYEYRTAYLAMIYFDRFLTTVEISDGKLQQLQLISLACLSLAAKMEECEARLLSEYTIEGYQFLESSILSMEMMISSSMDWRLGCATPFCFSNYFAAKFRGEESNEGELIFQANELILAIMEEIDVANQRPSIIAAAAVLAAYDGRLTKQALESKVDLIPSWGSSEKESTFACYSLFQETIGLKTPPESIGLPYSTTFDVIGDLTNTSIGRRRRLSYDSGNGDSPPMKTSRCYKE